MDEAREAALVAWFAMAAEKLWPEAIISGYQGPLSDAFDAGWSAGVAWVQEQEQACLSIQHVHRWQAYGTYHQRCACGRTRRNGHTDDCDCEDCVVPFSRGVQAEIEDFIQARGSSPPEPGQPAGVETIRKMRDET